MAARISDPPVSLPWLPPYTRDTERNIDRAAVFDEFTVAELPDPAGEKRWIYVSDESGGAIPAFNDGTNWRRATDRAIVS